MYKVLYKLHFQSKKTSHNGAMKRNLPKNLLTHYKTMMKLLPITKNKISLSNTRLFEPF